MKKFFLFTMSTLMLTGIFSSCRHQSELDINDLQGQAKITGIVKYNQGATKQADGSIILENLIPAAGQKVIVKVGNKDYADGAVGKQTYEGVVNEDGTYEVNVAIGIKTAEATVTVLPFRATKYVQVSDDVVTLENALFNEVTEQMFSLDNNDIKSADFIVLSNDEPQTMYNQKVTLEGKVETDVWKKNADTEVWEPKTTGRAVNLIIEVTEKIDGESSVILKYNAQANSEGAFKKEIQLPSNCWDAEEISVEIKTVPEIGSFSHKYYDKKEKEWKTQEIDVLYGEGSKIVKLGSDHKVIAMKFGTIQIGTTPVDHDIVRGIGNAIDTEGENDFQNINPFGW